MPHKNIIKRRRYDRFRYREKPGRREQVLGNVRKFALNNPNKIRSYRLKMTYGITFDDKKEMYRKQKRLCAACGKLFKSIHSAHVDHNHKTGNVRQLLHRHCNFVVGHEERNPGLLIKIMKYVRKHAS